MRVQCIFFGKYASKRYPQRKKNFNHLSHLSFFPSDAEFSGLVSHCFVCCKQHVLWMWISQPMTWQHHYLVIGVVCCTQEWGGGDVTTPCDILTGWGGGRYGVWRKAQQKETQRHLVMGWQTAKWNDGPIVVVIAWLVIDLTNYWVVWATAEELCIEALNLIFKLSMQNGWKLYSFADFRLKI